ncbi:MAG: hypothetical protein HFE64_09050 [Lachnospiraceae bacterium]|jgi:hypothetical protein|nr:hypothetical protein [Lachnospiraceae bacterium]
MLEFKVGEAFPLPPVSQEGAVFSVEPYSMMLIYRYDRPSEAEIQEFKTGEYQLAVTELRKVMFILSKFGRLNWSDCAYSSQLSDSPKELPELKEGHRGYAIDAFLVDCHDNTLKAHRLIRMNPEFSRKFRLLLLDDGQKSFQQEEYEQAVSNVYRMYSTKDLLKISLMQMKGRAPQQGGANE